MAAPNAPSNLELLLSELRNRRWTVHIFGNLSSPELYVAMHVWAEYERADVLILWDEKSATAYRTSAIDAETILTPKTVEWHYHGSPAWTIRAVLTIGAPGTPEAPVDRYVPDALCRVPDRFRGRRHVRRTGLNQPPGWSWF